MRPMDGKLVYHVVDTGTGHFTWYSYRSKVKVEVDIHMNKFPDQPAWLSRRASVNALFTYRRQTEVGCGHQFPRIFQGHLTFDKIGSSFYAPRLETRALHRYSIACYKGRVEYRIDNNLMDTQFVPNNWFGYCGVRVSDSISEVDNFEIYLPSKKAVDNKAIRDHYDLAATKMNKSDLVGALKELEVAATLQPDVRELGRLHAAYIVAEKQDYAEARKMLISRFSEIDHPSTLHMLTFSEEHIQLLTLDDEDYDNSRSVHISLVENALRDRGFPKKLNLMKASSGTGQLALYTTYVTMRNRKKSQAVSKAFELAMKRDPQSIGHRYRFAHFLKTNKKAAEAAKAIKPLLKLLPRATFLKKEFGLKEAEAPK